MTVSDLRVLVKNLDEYIHIPGGIERLKKTVLHLAVSGKLVPQIPNEGAGEDLYKQIQAEKANLIANGKLKKQKLLEEINKDELPFNVPASWVWVRLGNVSVYQQRGKSPKYTEISKFPVISQRCVRTYYLDWSVIKYITQESVGNYEEFRFLENGDLLLNSTGTGTMGRVGIFSHNDMFEKVVADSHVTVVRFSNSFSPKFAHIWLNSPHIQDDVEAKASGSTNQIEWNLLSIQEELLPLPPLAEQKRIVEKVSEIFTLIDELDKKYKAEEVERTKYVKSSLSALSHNGDKLALENVAKTIKTKADAAELRNAILHLAVSGRLVTQIISEGTGYDLYEQVQSEKIKLIQSGRIRRQKDLPDIDENELPSVIPTSWRWVRLGDYYDVRDGTHDTPKYVAKGYPLVTSKNLSSGLLDISNVNYISESDHKKIQERSEVVRGDILFAMIGSIGNPVLVDIDVEFSIKNVALFKPYDQSKHSSEWLLIYLTLIAEDMRNKSSGAVQSFVSLGYIRNYVAPLPPLAEQRRIVQKTRELLDLVSELEKHLEK